MPITKVETPASSMMTSYSYNTEEKTLDVTMKGGKVYRYSNIEREEFNAMFESASVGKFLNQQIKPKHQGVLVPVDPSAGVDLGLTKTALNPAAAWPFPTGKKDEPSES